MNDTENESYHGGNPMRFSYTQAVLLVLGALQIAAAAAEAQQLPDLTISRVDFVRGTYNGPCNLIRITVRNSQNIGVAEPIKVGLNIGIEGIAYAEIQNGIPPQGSASATFDRQLAASFNVVVDPENKIPETVEDNNTRSVSPNPTQSCPEISFGRPRKVEVNEGRVARLTVQLDRAFVRPVKVGWKIRGGTATAGRACPDPGPIDNRKSDYEKDGGIITFAPGTTRQRIAVSTCTDNKDEQNEYIDLVLETRFSPSNSPGINAPNRIIYTAPVNGTVVRGVMHTGRIVIRENQATRSSIPNFKTRVKK